MTNIMWPSSLPDYILYDSYSERPRQSMVTFSSDVGPDIERPKGTLRLRAATWTMIMSDEQLETFEDFFWYDLAQGSQVFYIKHPRLEDQVRVKLDGNEKYSVTPAGYRQWLVALNILVIG